MTHRATGHWGLQTNPPTLTAREPHSPETPSEVARRPLQSLSKRKKFLSPPPISHSTSHLTAHHLKHQNGQTLGQNAFPEALPHLGSKCFSKPRALKQSKGANSENKSAKKGTPPAPDGFIFLWDGRPTKLASTSEAGGLESRLPGVRGKAVLGVSKTRAAGKPRSPSSLPQMGFQEGWVGTTHPEEGPLRPETAAECHSSSCQASKLFQPEEYPLHGLLPHNHGEPSSLRFAQSTDSEVPVHLQRWAGGSRPRARGHALTPKLRPWQTACPLALL